MIATVLALHACGFSVIPVPRPDSHHGGKTPTLAWKGYQTTRATEAQVRAWFREPLNVAVVTGAISDLVVVDADSPEGLRWCTRHLRYTPWQVVTARGFHLYYRHPGVLVRNCATLATPDGKVAVDVRADGGYVIGPGSWHRTGHIYQWAGDWTRPRADVPRFWPGWIAKATPAPPPAPARRPTSDVLKRARRYLAAIPPPIIGAGSDADTLYAACRLVRGFELAEADAVDLLDEWAGGRPGWDRHWLAQKVAHAAKFGTEPLGALR